MVAISRTIVRNENENLQFAKIPVEYYMFKSLGWREGGLECDPWNGIGAREIFNVWRVNKHDAVYMTCTNKIFLNKNELL